MSVRSKSDTYTIWNYEMKIPGTSLTLKGHSRGSEKTGFYIPELKMFLDAGLQSYYNPQHIFITHCHSDHSFALPMLLTGITTTPTIYVPKENEDLFTQFTDSCAELFRGGVETKENKTNYSFVGVSPYDVIQINKEYFVNVVKLDHSVPCCGYGIVRKATKLKDEYKSLNGKDIAQLRKNNVNVMTDVTIPQFAFLCDTSVKVFDYHPELFSYPVIIIECTFIDNLTIETY